VFEQVRKPRAAWSLIARADVVGDVDGNHRGVVIFDRDHPQAVCQARFFQINAYAARLGRGGPGQREEKRREHKLFV